MEVQRIQYFPHILPVLWQHGHWFCQKKHVCRSWLTTFHFFFPPHTWSTVCGFASYPVLREKLSWVTSTRTLLSEKSGFVHLQRLERLHENVGNCRYPVPRRAAVPAPTQSPRHTVRVSLGTRHWAECSPYICHLVQPSSHALSQELSSSFCKETSLECSRSLHGLPHEAVVLGSKPRYERSSQPLFSGSPRIVIVFFFFFF